MRTGPMHGRIGAGGGVLSLHEAEGARLSVVAARLQLHLAAKVLVQPLLPALRRSMPAVNAWAMSCERERVQGSRSRTASRAERLQSPQGRLHVAAVLKCGPIPHRAVPLSHFPAKVA